MELFKLALILVAQTSFILAISYTYQVFPLNEQLVSPCPGQEEHAFDKALDLSNLTIEADSNGNLFVAGTFMPVWDSKPGDRILGRGGLYKFSRGQWIPVPLSYSVHNFCKVMYDPDELWFESGTSLVHEDDRVCITHKGALMRIPPRNVSIVLHNIPSRNFGGKYKVVVYFELFDEHDKRRDAYICTEIIIELERQ